MAGAGAPMEMHLRAHRRAESPSLGQQRERQSVQGILGRTEPNLRGGQEFSGFAPIVRHPIHRVAIFLAGLWGLVQEGQGGRIRRRVLGLPARGRAGQSLLGRLVAFAQNAGQASADPIDLRHFRRRIFPAAGSVRNHRQGRGFTRLIMGRSKRRTPYLRFQHANPAQNGLCPTHAGVGSPE